ncbi:MAG: peptidase S41 [Acidobacteria bacterium]|nr:MAG: peptidase S41 [Acidobacteriota bacterium]
MRSIFTALALSITFAALAEPALFEPSLSPDGKTVAFVSGGDIWTAPAGGGEAHLLVAHPAYDSRPLFSPDGKSLAFISTRTGNGDIYVADLTTSQTRRLTYDDGRDGLDAWSRDGKWIYFSSTGRSADTLANDIYRVAASGGTPMMVTDERMHNHYHAAPSPDGRSLALVGYGSVSAQWWRHGRSHMDETQLWLMFLGSAVARSRGSSASTAGSNPAQPSDRATEQPNQYRQLAGDGAKQVWPMWTPDGARLFYMSDRDGNENIWTMSVAAADAKQVTAFRDGRVLWPSIAYDGSAIVFERNFGIWRLDPASGKASAIPITLRGVAAAPAIEHRNINDRFSEFELSPDGKKFAFVARGEVFAAPTKDTGSATRVTNTPGLEFHLIWSPDSKSIVYVSDRDGMPHLYRYDFATEKETQLTTGDSSDLVPRFSPDGKLLAFERNHRELDVLDLATNQVKTLASGHFDPAPYVSTLTYDFSPDSKWIAFLDYDAATLFSNAFVVPVAGGTPRAVSFIANTNSDSLVWSRDGKFLLLVTGQRTETARIARVDLVPATPRFREEQFRELFQSKPSEEKAAAEVKPAEKKTAAVEIEFAGIRDRVRLIPVGHDVGEVVVSPDGKWIAYAGAVGDDQQVYVYSIDELSDDPGSPKQLSSSSGSKRALTFTPDNKEVWYLDNNKVAAATIDPAKARNVGVSAEMDVDFAREKEEAFAQMYTYLRDNFFDPNMNGVDWKAWRDRLAPYVGAALNGDEFRRLLVLMIGELNASHTGANPPGSATTQTTGRLGVRYDRDEYESHGALKVRDVIPLSPAHVGKIQTGEYIVAIDGKPVTASTNIDALLEYKNGKRTVVSVASSAAGTDLSKTTKRDVIVQPIDGPSERRLTYLAWVNSSRDYVHRISNGKLGYVHMYSMSFDALQKLYLDLDAENRAHQGVVIDLRNNHGGFVNVYAMDVFARRSYFTMTPRNFDTPSGARTVLGQRALEKPTVLVINRHTLSDGEDFTEGYRTLKLGKVVGEPTAGWIIYTSDYTLVDGTSLRLPSVRIRDTRGQDMEMHPRPVDRFVARPLGETAAGKDTQLDAAVEELLKELK